MIKIYLKYKDRNQPIIMGLKRVSKPGLRVYVGASEIPRPYGGMGIAIVSTRGQYYCVKYGAPHMKSSGSIVLFSGWISRKPAVEVSTLAAVDAAIEALARTLALELAPIRVNAITPGMIDTPLWGARLTPEQQREHFDNIAKSLPVGRAGTANDVAHAVMFLLENGFTTGSVLDIDGGQG